MTFKNQGATAVNRHPDWQTTKKERASYYVYFTGQGSIYMLVATCLTTYLLFSGIDPVKSATVMLAVKIWDALNDAIFGALFDMVKFKSKRKFIPWLKIASIAVPITTVLMFFVPTVASTEAGKLALFAVTYILWDTAYTLCDAPAFGIITTMTERQDERTSIQSYKSIWGAIGSGIALVLGSVLVSENVGLPYWVPALVCAAIAVVMMAPIGYNVKENTALYETDEKFTVKRMLKYLAHNKYLLIFYLGFLFYSGFGVAQALSLFASFYLFNNSMFSLFIIGISVAPALVSALLVPAMLKKIDKMKLFRICGICSVAMKFIIFFVGYSNVWVYLALAVVDSVPFSIMGVTLFMFTPDCAEYGRFTTGIDAKGITFSIQTFMAKLTAAISGSLGLFMLGLFGWKTIEVESFEELKSLGVAAAQSPEAIKGLWFTYALVPAIGVAVAIIVWCFYKLEDKDVQIMADANSGLITREEALSKLKIKIKKPAVLPDTQIAPYAQNGFENTSATDACESESDVPAFESSDEAAADLNTEAEEREI